MSEVNTASGLLNVALELNLKWLARLNLQEPIVLQNVYIADTNSNFPLSQFSQINVQLHPEINIARRVGVSLANKPKKIIFLNLLDQVTNILFRIFYRSNSSIKRISYLIYILGLTMTQFL